MWAGDQLGINYQPPQKVLQLGLLLITQLLSWRILTVLEVRLSMRILTVLYIGLSPALVNASLNLFRNCCLSVDCACGFVERSFVECGPSRQYA